MENAILPAKSKPRLALAGHTFGRLTVIAFAGRSRWECRCSCGNSVAVFATSLKQGITKSCGCYKLELARNRNRTHGMRHSLEYHSYAGAKSRCLTSTHPAYHHYGGRGIKFRFTSFEQFLADVGRKPTPKHTLDRINNDGHYEPGNVRWATRKQQSNNVRSNHAINYGGQILTATECARAAGIPPDRIFGRLRAGWCDECIVHLAPRSKRCPHPRRSRRRSR